MQTWLNITTGHCPVLLAFEIYKNHVLSVIWWDSLNVILDSPMLHGVVVYFLRLCMSVFQSRNVVPVSRPFCGRAFDMYLVHEYEHSGHRLKFVSSRKSSHLKVSNYSIYASGICLGILWWFFMNVIIFLDSLPIFLLLIYTYSYIFTYILFKNYII